MVTPHRLAALGRWVRNPPHGPSADRAYSVGILLAGLTLLALDVQMLGTDQPVVEPPGGALLWQTVVLLLGTTVLLLKRRRPVAVLVAVTVLVAADVTLGGSLGMYLVLFDALFTVARAAGRRARATVLAVLVALVLGVLVATVLAGMPARDVVQLTLVAGSLLLPPWWWGSDVRRSEVLVAEQSRRADAERARADLARAHADDVARIAALDRDRAVQEERTRMARDLHDVVAGHMSAVAIHTEAALAGPPEPGRDRAALAAARTGALDALAEMRAMILVLREGAAPDDVVAPPGLARADDLDVDVVGDVPSELPAAVDHTAFRILQEAATNARKHGAGRARVRATCEAGALVLVAENPLRDDDAPPADPALSSATGLVTMRERAVALGGTLTAGPVGTTWQVRARLPLTPTEVP